MRKTAFLMTMVVILGIFSHSIALAQAETGPSPTQQTQETEEVQDGQGTPDQSQPTDGEESPAQPGEEGIPEHVDPNQVFTQQGLDISQGSVPFEDEIGENVAVYMVETKTGALIHARNEDKRMYPASLTKIMTAILALEEIPDLSVTIPYKTYIQEMMYQINISTEGGISTGGLIAGEELTAEQLLYALMLPSANEVAVILADYISEGSLDYFAQMMNDKAREIGCTGTNFVNSNGLFDENHYTTAKDMYLITQYAMQNETFREVVSTISYNSGETNKHSKDNPMIWSTTNKMLVQGSDYYLPEIIGVKTGSLSESGRCLASAAEKDGYEYILVVLGAPYEDPASAFSLSKKFYNWAFENFKAKTIVQKGENVNSINRVRLAKDGTGHLQLMSGQTFTALLPQNIDVSNVRKIAYDLNGERINSEDYVNAPVEKGKKMGELHLMLYGSTLGKVDLLAAESIEASPLLVALDQLAGFFSSFWFKFCFIFVLIVVVCYAVLAAVRNKNRKRYSKMARRRRF